MAIKLETMPKSKPAVVSTGVKSGKNGWDKAKIKDENQRMKRSTSDGYMPRKIEDRRGETKAQMAEKSASNVSTSKLRKMGKKGMIAG